MDNPIERTEVQRAVKAMKSGKASGINGIVSEILKRGGEHARDDLAALQRSI